MSNKSLRAYFDAFFVSYLLGKTKQRRDKFLPHTRQLWRVCGNKLNIISMCAASPAVHTSNIS